MKKASVLFVCTGNICRSPTAEGVFRALAKRRGVLDRLRVDSAGTHDYHAGEAPDPRSIQHASRRGDDLKPLRARQVGSRDFADFGWILAMDRGHRRLLGAIAPPETDARIELFLEHSARWPGLDVPDPYYGGAKGFETVLDMVEEASERLLDAVLAGIGDKPAAGRT
ncbi:MAG: low molecular weight phosphotyrosine protein phosphatase [Betaproteobacteria bacterium]|nr:low molecular weight phosphotyrosine protein phosphatase [Betaproteobacteria bacterium]